MLRVILNIFIIFIAYVSVFSEGIKLKRPYIAGFHPLDEEPYDNSPLNAKRPVILQFGSRLFSDTVDIDFEKRQITFRKTDSLGYTLWEFHYGELSDYLMSRQNYAFSVTWKKEISKISTTGVSESKKGMKLEWEIPVQYPTWAQRVLGKEPPKITIDGFLEIKLGIRNTDFEVNSSAIEYRPTVDFVNDLNYQFTITGSVGKLININISASKEQNFEISDNLKNFKIEYKESSPGELEDEIVQEVIVGYTGFSMPGTNLSGYSESHEGLFGIKVRAKLGPLDLTTIASTEQGQANKKTYTSSSGSGNEAVFEAKEFAKNRYFFLDNIYRRYYIKKYAPQGGNSNPPPKVTMLSVWRSYDRTFTENKSNIKMVKLDTTNQLYLFERLERDKHYYLDPEEGYIRLADSINLLANQQLAIFMRAEDTIDSKYASLKKGKIEIVQGYDTLSKQYKNDTLYTLWILKPLQPIDSAGADTSRFFLMWRHVYRPANFEDLTNFKLKVERLTKDTRDTIEKYNDKFYTYILGLADNNNVLKTSNKFIYNTNFNDLVIPPHDTSFYGLEPFNNPELGEYRDSIIYRYDFDQLPPDRKMQYTTMYRIRMTGTKKRTTFDDLGWGIMEGTEVVKADGVLLERNKDYTIDYTAGIIDLISPRAKAAEKIEIDYQSEAIFVPDRKSFFGIHGKVDLPFISERSFAGMSALFQSTSTNEDLPRLDQEPYNRLLLDFNTHLEFQPEWMTKLINALPLVNTKATSSVSMDFEIAHSRVNPNKKKSAFIDDFEECKQSEPLSNDYKSWYKASPPYSTDSLWYYPPAWDFYWFNPRDQDALHRIKRDEILVLSEAERKASQLSSPYESVLRLHATPAPKSDELLGRFKKAWAGIMTPIPPSLANKEEAQYFEFFVKGDGGFKGKGKILLQFGEIKEDISHNGGPPNKREDREDTSLIVQNITYDKNLDVGLDGLADTNEFYLIPSSVPGKWDTLRYGDKLLGPDSLDPSKDNYRQYYYDKGDIQNYRYTSRLQNNGELESEDIDYDGVAKISMDERYFQFTVDLEDSTSPFIDRSVNHGDPASWRKYRIPLKEKIPAFEQLWDTINRPSWTNIRMVRVIWTDFDSTQLSKEQKLVFYNFEFVGNQWISIIDSTGKAKIRSSVINTKEDKNYETYWQKYKNVITREKDVYGYEIEQSLRLNFENLRPGDTALVKKSLIYQTLNLSAYKKLSLAVFGVVPDGVPLNLREPLYDGDIYFVFRFGSDDSTYYEYSQPIYPEWNNVISIDLRELSDLKDSFLVAHRDSAINVSNGTLRIKAPIGRQPLFSKIRWMAVGVFYKKDGRNREPLNGEIWVNEMKLTNIRNLNGIASRFNLSTNLADLLSFQSGMEYENGNFRRMTETQNLPDNSQLSASSGITFNLNKFLPEELGISIPSGINYSINMLRPQLKNESDVYLLNKNGEPDGFFDIVNDAFQYMTGIKTENKNITRAELYQTSSVSRTYYTNYKKNKHDNNPIISLLTDRWEASVRYTRNLSEVLYGLNSTGDTLFSKRDTADIYGGRISYDLTPNNPPEWMSIRPFKDIKSERFPSQVKEYELTFLPKNFKIDAADLSLTKNRSFDTWRKLNSFQNSFTSRHNMMLDYSPIDPLIDMNFRIDVSRDLVDAVNDDNIEKGRKIFKRNYEWRDYWLLWGEKNRAQNFGLSFNPNIINWLEISSDYKSDYNASTVKWLNEPQLYLSTNVKNNFSLQTTLRIDDFLEEFISSDTSKNEVFFGFFKLLKQSFNEIGLGSVNFNYNSACGLRNEYISTSLLKKEGIYGIKDFTLFQLGVKGRSLVDIIKGEMDDSEFLGMRSRYNFDRREFYKNDSRRTDRNFQLSTSLNIKSIDITVNNISLSYGVSFNIFPDSLRNDTTITFPEISLGVSSEILNRIEIIKNNIDGLSLSSNFQLRQSDRFTSTSVGGSNRSVKIDFTPLLSLSGKIKKWPIRFNYRHNFSKEYAAVLREDKKPSKEPNKNATLNSDELTLDYDFENNSKLSEIKLLTWVIPIKGKTSVGLSVNYTNEKETVAGKDDKNFSLIPKLSYIFTDNVTGRAEYAFRFREIGGKKTTENEFAVTVRITF
ncbi:MAG: cell surface protein SprA [Chitinispirillaceae bacterium]|nr:cell surface protein SprA [Chitinispirillaceae bacterium]